MNLFKFTPTAKVDKNPETTGRAGEENAKVVKEKGRRNHDLRKTKGKSWRKGFFFVILQMNYLPNFT